MYAGTTVVIRAETVLERRNDAAAVRVILRVRGCDDEEVERQPHLIAADLDVALFHDVEEADLHALGEVGELVQREDAAMRARHEAVVDRHLVREVASLSHLYRVDLPDEVSDRNVRCRELLAVPLVGREPHELDRVTVVGHAVFASGADRCERIVVDLAARDRGNRCVEQLYEPPREASLRLAALS